MLGISPEIEDETPSVAALGTPETAPAADVPARSRQGEGSALDGPQPAPAQPAPAATAPQLPGADLAQASAPGDRRLDPVEPEPSPGRGRSVTCGSLGPVEEGREARDIASELQRVGVDATLRRETVVREGGYWVIIPPYATAQEARDAVAQLQSRGVTDIRRFFKGEYQNGVSVGLFSRRANAEGRRRQIAALGFPVQVLPRQREVPLHWVDFRATGESARRGVDRVAASYPQLQRSETPCPRIVTRRGIL